MVMAPVTEPSVAVVEATPLTSVVVEAGVNDAAPPGVALHVTCTPDAGCPLEFNATKLRGNASVAPVLAVWLSPATPVTDAACGPLPVLSPQAATAASAPARARGMNRLNIRMLPPHYLGTTR